MEKVEIEHENMWLWDTESDTVLCGEGSLGQLPLSFVSPVQVDEEEEDADEKHGFDVLLVWLVLLWEYDLVLVEELSVVPGCELLLEL